MRINVAGLRPEHTINGLEVNLDAGVERLRRDIAERIGTAPERLRLIHMGHLIDDSRPLSSFLREDATIHVVPVAAPTPPTGSPEGNNNEHGGASAANLPDVAAAWRGMQNPFIGLFQHSLAGLAEQMGGRLPVVVQSGIVGSGMGLPPRESSQTPPPQQPQQSQQQQQQQPQQQQQQEQQQPQQQPPQNSEGQPHQHHRFSFSYAIPTPEVVTPSPVHVHVHVTMDELEQLPERLERFRNRMRLSGSNASLHVERGPLPPTTTASAQTAAAGAAAPENNNHGTNSTTPSGSENRAPHASPQTIGDIFNALSETTGDNGGEAAVVEELLYTLFRDLTPMAAAQFVAGDFSFLAPSRQRVVGEVMRLLGQREETAEGTLRADQRRHLEREVDQIIEGIQQDPAFMELIRRNTRPQSNFLRDIKRYLVFVCEEIVCAVLSPVSDSDEWANGVRVALFRVVGVAAERTPVWFERGPAGLADLIISLAQTSATRLPEGRARDTAQSIAQAGSLARGLLPLVISGWHAEYLSRHRRDTDSAIFEGAAAAPERGDEADGLLDDCLDEFCADNGAGAADHADASTDRLRSALRAYREVTRDEEDDICRRARRFRLERPPADADTDASSTIWKHLKK
ncbi:ubiquitin-like protein [Trypanosoma conorhini]|uniref:Ubiquitin-like protein n=1 Tax=Trypanosoma conorhini TaxID=83891 RepID=A0A422PE25_9TRYP|nr:ubiquitin-like protein [Trypanosoma conorhini]RNF15950.1 ubiquitin-like protein [Trypanosoma conorhini]